MYKMFYIYKKNKILEAVAQPVERKIQNKC